MLPPVFVLMELVQKSIKRTVFLFFIISKELISECPDFEFMICILGWEPLFTELINAAFAVNLI